MPNRCSAAVATRERSVSDPVEMIIDLQSQVGTVRIDRLSKTSSCVLTLSNLLARFKFYYSLQRRSSLLASISSVSRPLFPKPIIFSLKHPS